MSDQKLSIKVLFEALDKISSPLKAITAKASQSREKFNQLNKSLKGLEQIDNDVKRLKLLSGELNNAGNKVAFAQKRLIELSHALKNSDGDVTALKDEFKRLNGEMPKLIANENKLQSELSATSRKLSSAGIDVADLAHSEQKLAQEAYKAERALEAQRKELNKLHEARKTATNMQTSGGNMMMNGGGAIAAGAVISLPIINATKDAMKFENAMADAKKVLNDWTPEGLAQLNKDVIELSTKIPLAREEIAAIVAAGGQDGIGAKLAKAGDMKGANAQLLAFATDAAQMAIAFDVSAQNAGESMAHWRAGMRLTQDQIRELGNIANALSDSEKGGKASDINEIVTRVGSNAKIGGMGYKSVAAIGSLMSGVGVDADRAGTGVTNMMLALVKGENATKGQQAVWQKLGLDAVDVAKKMQINADGTILDVFERISKLPKFEQASTVESLFGREGLLAIAPMLSELDELKNKLKFVGNETNYADSMSKEFYNRIATAQGATGLLTNSLGAMNVTLGQQLAPTWAKVATSMKPALDKQRKWMEQNPEITQGIAIFVAILGGLIAIAGVAAVGIGAITWAMGALGIASWAALGPWLLIAAAIAAVIAIGVILWQNWDKWGKDLSAFFDDLPHKILIAFANLHAKLFDAGRNAIQGLINGMFSKKGDAQNASTQVAHAVNNGVKKTNDIRSPSRLWRKYGQYLNQGMALGLTDNMIVPVRRAQKMANAISSAVAFGAPGKGGAMVKVGGNNPQASTNNTGSNIFNIYATPNQSVEDIAREVARMLERKAGKTASAGY